MAQDIVVKDSLSDDMIRAGAVLTRQLDESGWPSTASFWFYVPDGNRWQLVLASPKVTSDGPREAYAAIQEALSAAAIDEEMIGLEDVAVVPADLPLVRTLRSVIATGSGISGIRFSNNVINGHFIDDAYIYRLK